MCAQSRAETPILQQSVELLALTKTVSNGITLTTCFHKIPNSSSNTWTIPPVLAIFLSAQLELELGSTFTTTQFGLKLGLGFGLFIIIGVIAGILIILRRKWHTTNKKNYVFGRNKGIMYCSTVIISDQTRNQSVNQMFLRASSNTTTRVLPSSYNRVFLPTPDGPSNKRERG